MVDERREFRLERLSRRLAHLTFAFLKNFISKAAWIQTDSLDGKTLPHYRKEHTVLH